MEHEEFLCCKRILTSPDLPESQHRTQGCPARNTQRKLQHKNDPDPSKCSGSAGSNRTISASMVVEKQLKEKTKKNHPLQYCRPGILIKPRER